MLRSAPRAPMLASDALARCIDACFDCAQACTGCADAGLGEESVAELTRCIAPDLDRADLCNATGSVLSRQVTAGEPWLWALIDACAEACASCAAECERHAAMHEHCDVRAEVCRICESRCREVQLLAAT
jgi:hypothetical protein